MQENMSATENKYKLFALIRFISHCHHLVLNCGCGFAVTCLICHLFASGDTRSVVETDGHRAINPSIGPSIGEMSVGMTNSLSASGSHLERVGVIREDCCSDRDSASHQAMAGSCINASLSGSLLAGPTGFHNRSDSVSLLSLSVNSVNCKLSEDRKSSSLHFISHISTLYQKYHKSPFRLIHCIMY